MEEPLSLLDPVLNKTSGARFEGDVFAILRHSPYIVRSSEFGNGDGALDCAAEYDPHETWASRFQNVAGQEPDLRKMALFDAKSAISCQAGRQEYWTTTAQRAVVAFYICTPASDPFWIDLIPNCEQSTDVQLSGKHTTEQGASVVRDRAINVTRLSWLQPRAYGMLDPCGTPCRMPRWMLPEAIARIRSRILTGKVYRNPWTNVAFPEWNPITTRHIKWMEPTEDSQQYAAHKQTMDIMRAFHYKSHLTFDFVGLQPRLADFKLDDYLVQLKADGRTRPAGSHFKDVLIHRHEKNKTRYYFSAFERFDYFMYLFEYSGTPIRRAFFFIPEREIPDSFYTSLDIRESFECFEQQFLHDMDENLEWVKVIEDTISRWPTPRRSGARPVRNQDLEVQSGAQDGGTTSDSQPPVNAVPSSSCNVAQYVRVMRCGMQTLYDGVMEECCRRGKGVLVVLSRNHSLGDFLYCRYRWSAKQQQEWRSDKKPPVYLHDLPPAMVGTGVSYYAYWRETSYLGPPVTEAQFRRLNSSQQPRLILFDLSGADDLGDPFSSACIPSVDISYTEEQRQLFVVETGEERAMARPAKTPYLSSLIDTSLVASEYATSSRGPFSNPHANARRMWDLFDKFSGADMFHHPPAKLRNPTLFQCTIEYVNQLLKDQLTRHVDTRDDIELIEAQEGSDA